MNKKHNGKTRLETMLVMLVLIMFSVSAYTMVVATSSSYAKNQDDTVAKDNLRLATSYIDSKIKQSESKDISLTDISISDKRAISIKEKDNGASYLTLIYLKDGFLKELLVQDGTNLEEVEGNDIASIKDMDAVLNGKCLKLSVKTQCGTSKEYSSQAFININ